MQPDGTPHSFIVTIFNDCSIKIFRDRKNVKHGMWDLDNLTKPTLVELAKLLTKRRITYTTQKSKTYGDVFSFTYSDMTYAINCKNKTLTVYFNKAKIK